MRTFKGGEMQNVVQSNMESQGLKEALCYNFLSGILSSVSLRTQEKEA